MSNVFSFEGFKKRSVPVGEDVSPLTVMEATDLAAPQDNESNTNWIDLFMNYLDSVLCAITGEPEMRFLEDGLRKTIVSNPEARTSILSIHGPGMAEPEEERFFTVTRSPVTESIRQFSETRHRNAITRMTQVHQMWEHNLRQDNLLSVHNLIPMVAVTYFSSLMANVAQFSFTDEPNQVSKVIFHSHDGQWEYLIRFRLSSLRRPRFPQA